MKKLNLKSVMMLLMSILFLSTSCNNTSCNKKDNESKHQCYKKFHERIHQCCKKIHEGNHQCCKDIPNLTDEQKSKIKELKIVNMKNMLALKNQLNEKTAHLKTLTTAEKVDMKAVNQTIDEIGSIKIQMMKNCVAHQQEIRKLLTEEQRVYFDMKAMNRTECNHQKGIKNSKAMNKTECNHQKGVQNSDE